MSLPLSDFAATFRSLVMPKLRDAVESRGFMIALDLRSFNESHREILSMAGRWGAWNLPCPHFDALIEWSQSALLDAACKAMSRVAAHEIAMAHVHADVERCDAAITALVACER